MAYKGEAQGYHCKKWKDFRDEAITASTRNYYDYLIKESIKERGYARMLFENEFKFSCLANIVGIKYKPSTKTYFVRATTKKGRTMGCQLTMTVSKTKKMRLEIRRNLKSKQSGWRNTMKKASSKKYVKKPAGIKRGT